MEVAELDFLAKRGWGSLVAIGLAAVAFGILALAWNEPTTNVLEILIGIFLLATGLFFVAHAGMQARRGESYAGSLILGIAGVAAALATLVWPDITSRAILYLLAVWAIFAGVIQLYTAYMLKRAGTVTVMFSLAGVLSIVFGVLLIAFPEGGATKLVWLIGIYAIILGMLYLIAGFEARHTDKEPA